MNPFQVEHLPVINLFSYYNCESPVLHVFWAERHAIEIVSSKYDHFSQKIIDFRSTIMSSFLKKGGMVLRKSTILLVFIAILAIHMFGSLSNTNANPENGTSAIIHANIQKAMEAIQIRRFADAIRYVRENQQLEPHHYNHVRQEAWIYGVWGVTLKRESGIQRASPYFQKSIEKYHESIQLAITSQEGPDTLIPLYHQLALVLIDYGDYDQGYEVLMTSLELDDTHVISNYLLGIIQRERYAKMIQENQQAPITLIADSDYYFERAVRYNSSGLLIPYAYFFAGVKSYQSKRYDEALELLKEWLIQIEKEKGSNLTQQDAEFIDYAQEIIAQLE